jgi:hypothetical protein
MWQGVEHVRRVVLNGKRVQEFLTVVVNPLSTKDKMIITYWKVL